MDTYVAQFLLLFSYFFVASLALSALASYFLLRMRTRQTQNQLPPISIIKPISGFDPALYQNLKSFFTLEYPEEIEIIIVAEKRNDPAWEVVDKLIKEHPNATVTRVISGTKSGWSPKSWNLAQAVSKARFDQLVFADADSRITLPLLTDLVLRMNAYGIGAAYAQPIVENPVGLGGILDAAAINFTALIVQPILNGIQCDELAGTLNTIKKSVVCECGGFKSIRNNIADDICLGQLLKSRNYKLALTPQPIKTHSGFMSFAQFLRHQTRWLVTWRSTSSRISVWLSFLYSPTFFGTLSLLFSFDYLIFILPIPIAEMCLMVLIEKVLNARKINAKIIFLLPISLFIMQIISIYAIFVKKVVWRGSEYHLDRDGRILSISSEVSD